MFYYSLMKYCKNTLTTDQTYYYYYYYYYYAVGDAR